ncbi:MAG: hypothetical protein V4481_05745 [Patescibacteria group bacterium]
MFLFLGLPWMRGRMDSAEAFKRFAVVCEKHPWILDPRNLAKTGYAAFDVRTQLRKILLENGLGFGVQDAIKFWMYNCTKLVRFWNGDPLLIFEGVEDYDELCRRFMQGKNDPDSPTGFLGIRHKMVSMFIYFLARAKILEPKYMYAGPFDIHNARITTSTEAIEALGGTKAGTEIDFYPISEVGRELYMTYCKTPDDVLDLADAFWYLSRDLCAQAQGNNMSRRISPEWEGEKEAALREGRRPNKRKKHVLLEIPVVWTDEKIALYHRTCGICSIESVCKWTLPSAPNYGETKMKLVINGERPKPHTAQYSFLQVPKELRGRGSKPVKPPVYGIEFDMQNNQTKLF